MLLTCFERTTILGINVLAKDFDCDADVDIVGCRARNNLDHVLTRRVMISCRGGESHGSESYKDEELHSVKGLGLVWKGEKCRILGDGMDIWEEEFAGLEI